jgi:hypothetical protein
VSLWDGKFEMDLKERILILLQISLLKIGEKREF